MLEQVDYYTSSDNNGLLNRIKANYFMKTSYIIYVAPRPKHIQSC